MQKLDISAELFTPADDELDGQSHLDCRVQFSLFDSDGKEYKFIVDLPNTDENDSVDLWMVGSTVQIGDTPEDGFATFTPNP